MPRKYYYTTIIIIIIIIIKCLSCSITGPCRPMFLRMKTEETWNGLESLSLCISEYEIFSQFMILPNSSILEIQALKWSPGITIVPFYFLSWMSFGFYEMGLWHGSTKKQCSIKHFNFTGWPVTLLLCLNFLVRQILLVSPWWFFQNFRFPFLACDLEK